MTHLKEGDKAPLFEGINQNEKVVKLADYKGKRLVLFFYPKDNTSGCTSEVCNLNENYDKLMEEGFEVIGVSPDSADSHLKFIAKHSLGFDLIADTEKRILQDYGVWGEKSMYGRKYMGVFRTTFIISEEGIIEKIFEKVKTKEHTQQILKEMK